jgi:hypothetical protein
MQVQNLTPQQQKLWHLLHNYTAVTDQWYQQLVAHSSMSGAQPSLQEIAEEAVAEAVAEASATWDILHKLVMWYLHSHRTAGDSSSSSSSDGSNFGDSGDDLAQAAWRMLQQAVQQDSGAILRITDVAAAMADIAAGVSEQQDAVAPHFLHPALLFWRLLDITLQAIAAQHQLRSLE